LIISSTPSFTQRKPSAGERSDVDGEDDAREAEEGKGLCMSVFAAERGGRPSRAEPLPPLPSSSRRGTQIRVERGKMEERIRRNLHETPAAMATERRGRIKRGEIGW